MDSGIMIAMGSCFSCGRVFQFDPDRVPSLSIRFGTGRGTDLPTEVCPQGPCDNCSREPVCPRCAKAANPERRANGFEAIYEGDTAADLVAGRPHRV